VDALIGWLGAIFNLDNPAKFFHWGFIQISISNLIVILLMIAVFIGAIFIPFPGREKRQGGES
jgi:energy-coupling factor transporter transmembrane protein EcfT